MGASLPGMADTSREQADWIAARMPDVVQKGGVFDNAAWLPVLDEGGIDVNDTTAFPAGSENLVILDKWLVEPKGDGAWRAREWLGPEDEHYAAAVEGEAVPDDAGAES